jgi:hypothetical protein
MRFRAGSFVKAGLFLLFSFVLAVLAPSQCWGVSGTAVGAVESQSGSSEHREDEKRERLPVVATIRHEDSATRHRRLPGVHLRVRDLDSQIAATAASGPRAGQLSENRARARHSPAALQVYRH